MEKRRITRREILCLLILLALAAALYLHGLQRPTGGLLSTLAMWLIWKKTRFSLLLTGVCGALAHNAAQLSVALALTGRAALFYIPAMLPLSVVCGFCTGLVLRLLLPLLERFPPVRKK